MGLTEKVDGRNEARVEYAEVNVRLPPCASDRHRSDEHDDCTAQTICSASDTGGVTPLNIWVLTEGEDPIACRR